MIAENAIVTTERGKRRSAGTVLIVEDQPAVAKALALLLDIHGIESDVAATAVDAQRAVANGDIDLVLQDMNFTPGTTSGDEGIALFRHLRQLEPSLPIVLLTAWTSVETAVQMVKEGARDYLAKPWSDEKLLAIVTNVLDMRHGDRGRRVDRASLARSFDLRGMVYESAAMHRVASLALQVAASDVPVLITGPNGSGKEKIAEIIHANSPRRRRALVKVNAGALPDPLLESELFGAEPGAFTGANRLRIGRFESANGGTLFLDEIGNLSAAGQMKLLHVLQNGEFERLGSSETRRADVRLLCATNADLREAVSRGTFRQDLLFRLDVVGIHVPPLRERPEDIVPIAEHLLASFVRSSGVNRRFGEDARAALVGYEWPGNVRELENRIRRAMVTALSEVITAADLNLTTEPGARLTFGERERIEALLREARGSVASVARQLGVSRQALYRRMERLGIVLERRPRE